MNKLRIYTKVGIFEIMCETEPVEELHSLVEKAFVDAQTTFFSGSTKKKRSSCLLSKKRPQRLRNRNH